jgi:dipeptidyl aminopeptidase/acylaminoacyl peptidase
VKPRTPPWVESGLGRTLQFGHFLVRVPIARRANREHPRLKSDRAFGAKEHEPLLHRGRRRRIINWLDQTLSRYSSMSWIFLLLGLLLPAVGLAQEASIQPNENLEAEGIPPLPAQIATTAEKYTDYRQATLGSWDPTGRQILILTRFADTRQVHLVQFPGGDRKQLTFSPDSIHSAQFPSEPANYFLFTKDVGGSEFYQIYRFDLDNGDTTLLTDGKSRNENSLWSHQGKRLVYTSTRRNGKDDDLYVIDDANAATDRLLAQVDGGGWEPADWSLDNRSLLVLQRISINQTNLFLVDASTGQKTQLNEPDKRVAYGSALFSHDGKGLYVTSDLNSEFQTLGWVDLSTRRFTPITQEIQWNVELITMSPDGSKLAFETNEDGINRVYILDTATRQYHQLNALPEGVIGQMAWNPNNRDLAFAISSYDAPSDIFSVDVTSGKLERWTESETGGIPRNAFVKPELIKWPSFDGRTISGFIYKKAPSETKKLPVIILIHGGPEAQFRPNFLGRSNYFLNEFGVALICPNVRGSDGYGKTFLDLDNTMKREDSVKDVGALLDWVKTQPDLDSDRVMIMGGSYGGYMALACSFHYADRIRCSIDVVGISNFVTFLENTEAYRRDLRRVEYGDERDSQMRAFLLRISPLNHVAEITKPIFVVAGQNDPRVPVNESRQIVDALKQRGRIAWYLVAKDEGHGFAKKANADFAFYAQIKFIQDELLNRD